MSNLAGKAYAMNVVTPMRPPRTWVNNLLFMASRALPGTLSGLLGLSFIHFARWVIIRRSQWPQFEGQPPLKLSNDYMLFCSNFNGTWDQYIDAFADGIPGGLDMFWYSSTKYPNSIPITPFKTYIRSNQVDTSYYYNATPGSGQRDIKLALKLAHQLAAIKGSSMSDDSLASEYEKLLIANQGGLCSPGYAPVASCDTANADTNRADAELDLWGEGGSGPIEGERIDGIEPEVLLKASAAPVEATDLEAVRAVVTAALNSTPHSDEPPRAPELVPDDAADNGDKSNG